MNIEYRKHKSGRQFARIEGKQVLRVRNVLEETEVFQTSRQIVANYITTDEFYVPCTEQEFNTAYQEALQRIKEMKIV